MPVIDSRTMRQVVDGLGGTFVFRLAASLAGVLGIVGLALALVGVYGVVPFVVCLRTHEVGIRMAIGAGRSDIFKLISGQSLRPVIAGLLVGIVLAILLARAMAKLLLGLATTDPAHLRCCHHPVSSCGPSRQLHSSEASDARRSDGRAPV